tara:strand:- start:609 stop:890 length:282 start_codon:yes stop_codon:yes gene_type:complete
VFEQKKTKQNEQKTVSSLISSPEVRENDPLEPYRPHIDNFDLTEEQKLELVGAIHAIAHMVLDVQFGTMKRRLTLKKPVDEEAVSINGDRHEN